MNFKKIKESLISAVLGSSLFLVNGGVICQQPRAWLSDEFINSETEKYANNPEMTKIIEVLKFFSDLHKKPEYAGVLATLVVANKLKECDLLAIEPNHRKDKWHHRFIFSISFQIAVVPIETCRVTVSTIKYRVQEVFNMLYGIVQWEAGKLHINDFVKEEINSVFEIAKQQNCDATTKLTDLQIEVNNLLDSETPTASSSSTFHQTGNTPVCFCHTLSLRLPTNL